MGKHKLPPKNFGSWKSLAASNGIGYSTFISRVHNQKWEHHRAATEPVKAATSFIIDGVTRTAVEWAQIYKVSVASTYKRLFRGDDLITALTAPRRRTRLTSEERCAARLARRNRIWNAIQKKIQKYKERPCMDCGCIFHFEAMEFDHVRGEKQFNLSRPPLNLRRIAEEIAKCDLVCAVCHRIRTVGRRK
jgi:hypothetical protein